MASQPSVHNEERNLLRLRAWEQRNQEASRTKDLSLENAPLFGEPYKTNKGDDLSHRIQRMLGCYEDVNNPCSNAIESLPIPTCVSFLSDQGLANTYKSTKTQLKLHNQALPTQSQKGLSSNSSTTQPVRTSTTASLPSQHGPSSPFSKTSLNQSQGSQFSHSVYQQQKSKVSSDLREYVNLPQESSALFPDSKPLPLQDSTNNNIEMDTREIFDRHQLQGSTDYSSGSSSSMDVSTLNIKQSLKDGSLPQAKTNTLPSQTFPSLLSSKQPGIVMTQKPTAYVRPMDGQDQMVSESPDLKPSPEHYAPLPDLIGKSDLGKTKVMPSFLETTTEEAQFVKDILREMTHSWPPLLTAIQTPTIDEPSKSPFTAKEAECVSSCPVQRNLDSCPTDQSHFSQQRSSISCEVARSSGIETSSSDSDSSPGSESDSENSTEEPRQPPEGSAVKTGPDAPAVSHGDWLLGNWIRSSQQNSSSEGRGDTLVSESPFHKLLPHAQTSKKPSVDTTEDCESQLSSHQKELTEKLAIPQQCSENSQDNHCFQQSCTEYPPADVSSCSNSKRHSEPAAAVSTSCNEVAFNLKSGDVVTTQTKGPCYTDTPKVKTKTRHCKKDRGDPKKDIKRSKHAKHDKRTAGTEVALLYGHCSSCGVRAPRPCSCPAQSPAQRDQVSPAPPISCNKPKLETCDQNSTKMPRKSTHKDSEKSGNASKGCWDHYQPPRSLLVKIDLSLLSQPTQTSSIHKRVSSSTKRPALVIEQLEGAGDAAKTRRHNKTSKKSQNVNTESKIPSKKKQKLENKNTALKQEISSNPAEVRVLKKAKKHFQDPTASKDTIKQSKLEKCISGKTQESTKEAVKKKDSHKHNKSHKKQTEHLEKRKPQKSSRDIPSGLQPRREPLINRPLLAFNESQYPVKHYIKEAKRLKHTADAESDKLSKAFSYLEAAMFFVESGIAMEKDPHISVSSYTMFAETVELLKFVIKLKNPVDSSAPSSEKDFLALCMRCQCLLQMAMFHHKQKTALMYSKTLTDHFQNFTQEPHNPPMSSLKITGNPSPSMPSPSSSSGPGSNHSASGSGVGPVGSIVTVPQEIEQVAFTYVSITTLFLSAHDFWEQAEELARKGSGMLADLDTVLGPLSLASSLSSMVCYTRQGIHWLRLDSQKV